MPSIHLLIKGKVQGVFYRATAKEMAQELGVTGWIRNTNEGDVEAIVSGTEEALQKFIEWCKQGPRKAKVDDVIVTGRDQEAFDKFSIERR